MVRIPRDPAAPFPILDFSASFLIRLNVLPAGEQNHILFSHNRAAGQELPWQLQVGNPAVGSSCSSRFGAGELALVWEVNGGGDVRVASGLFLNPGTWNHIVVTRTIDPGTGNFTASFFRNGLPVSTRTQLSCSSAALDPTVMDQDLTIGRSLDGTNVPAESLDAELDEVALWNRPLNAAEVAELFAGALARPLGRSTCPGLLLEAGLVGYWRFNEPATSQGVTDSSGMGHHGFLGQTTAVEVGEPVRSPSSAPLAHIRQISGASVCTAGIPTSLILTGAPGGLLQIDLPSPGAFALAFGSCTAPFSACAGALFLPQIDVLLLASGPASLSLPWTALPVFSEVYVQAAGLGPAGLTGVSEAWLIRGL